jgi:hypothetical protein
VALVFAMLALPWWGPAIGWPSVIGIEALSLVALVGLNRAFLGFVMNTRGAGFAARAVPMLWLQYAYSGLGFAIGTLVHLRDRVVRRRQAADLGYEAS